MTCGGKRSAMPLLEDDMVRRTLPQTFRGRAGWLPITADRSRQPIAPEKPDQHLAYVSLSRALHVAHQQKESGGAVSHRQRKHPLSVSGVEPSFKVDRPQVIGMPGDSTMSINSRSGKRSTPGPASQTGRLQPAGDRSHPGPRTKPVFLFQIPSELIRSGEAIVATQRQHTGQPPLPQSIRNVRAVRPLA